MIICNYHDRRIDYVVTSADEQSIQGKVDPSTFKTDVNPPGKKPWTVVVDLSHQFTPVDAPDAVVSFWAWDPKVPLFGGIAYPPKA